MTVPGIADEDMPDDPLENWGDEAVKRRFGAKWVEWFVLKRRGANQAALVHALHDELVRRNINPAIIIRDHGYEVREDRDANDTDCEILQ